MPEKELAALPGNDTRKARIAQKIWTGTTVRMSWIAAGDLELPNVSSLVAKFNDLVQRLNAMHDLELQQVVDMLLPADTPDCRVLREAAILAVPECQNLGDLFESLKTVATQPEMPEEGDFVRIMSLHKSKGLTSKVTIVAGCIRGLIPFQDSSETFEEQTQILREQRRLFYVAITRATEILVLSSALRLQRDFAYQIGAVVQGGGNPVRAVASQFLGEFGPQAPQARTGAQWRAAGYV